VNTPSVDWSQALKNATGSVAGAAPGARAPQYNNIPMGLQTPAGGAGAATLYGPQPTQTPQAGVLSSPGYGEDWYRMYGNDINQPTNTQKLFDRGMSATDSLYGSATDMTNRSINAATAARGIYDGTAAIGSIGLADADLRAKQVQDYEQLGQAADQANQGAYQAASGAANAAQNQTTSRVQDIVGGQEKLSSDQASTIASFYDLAEKGQLTGDMASIEAKIQASGVDAATAQALTNDLLQIGGIAAKAGSGGK